MQLLTCVAAVLALTTASMAQQEADPTFDAITKPGMNEKVPAGKTYTIEWTQPDTAPDGPVTLSLIGGKVQKDQHPLSEIGKAQNSDLKFDWDVSSDLGDLAVYGIVIALDADPAKFQYSTPFQIVGGSSSGNDTSSSTTSKGGPTATGTATTGSEGGSDTSSSKGHKPTGGAATTVTTNTTAAETTASGSASETGSASGTTSAPATKTSDSGAARAVVGLLGGLAVAALAL